MKLENIGKFMAFSFAGLMLGSCLDFDVTGAEFNQTQSNVEKVTRRGQVDSIGYRGTITKDDFEAAMKACETNFGVATGGVYALRGGKKGELPGTHQYQYQFMLGADQYAQYGVIPHVNFPYSGIDIETSYSIHQKAYGGAYGAFHFVEAPIVPLLNMEAIDKLPEIKAIFLLIYDYAALEIADIYGPLPYQDIKTNRQAHPYIYNDLETIYNTVEANIDTIVNCLRYFPQKEEWYRKPILERLVRLVPINMEGINKGYTDLDVFVRFANSLKLRMAMHIVKVDPGKAKRWAEEAVAGGVVETEAHEMALYGSMLGFQSPLIEGWNSWGDMRMSAGMEQVLKGLNHPFLNLLFEKNERIWNNNVPSDNPNYELKPGTDYKGIRTGTYVEKEQNGPTNPYNGFSKINQLYIMQAPLYLMKLSEVCFLRAEGAVRGWNMGGSAKDFYEQGIRAGDIQDRVTGLLKGKYEEALDTYMAQESATPFTYVDPTGETDPIQSEITIGVKWNEGDSKEVKLEKIITQKWITGFPVSFEAWVDLRRTGYPRLFDVLNPEDGDGSLDEGDIIRRLPFPDTSDQSVLLDVTTTGLKALGGADEQATRLWWDVNKDNF